MKALTTLRPALGLSLSLSAALAGCSDARRTSTSEEPSARELSPSVQSAKIVPTELTLAEAAALLWPQAHEDRFASTTARERDATRPIIDEIIAALADGSSPDQDGPAGAWG